jgi:hypothetical protein
MARVRAQQGTTLRFVELPTASLIKLERDDGRNVEGAFVKLTPRLRRSERAAFDASAATKALLGRGAVAVTVAPVLLPDEVGRPVVVGESHRRVDAREEVRTWFAEEHADVTPEKESACEGCIQILDQVGL